MPGNITSRNSFGTNYLIKGAGAKLVQQWQDMAAELPPQIAASFCRRRLARRRRRSRWRISWLWCRRGCPDLSSRFSRLLSADNPAHIDALVDRSRLSISDLTSALLTLEMRDLVRALPGKCFVRKM